MSIELKVPSAGESITEVTIVEWTKEEGAQVQRDEIVAVIETDKANVEVVAPVEGRLTRIVHPVGEVVKVGAVIGLLEAQGLAEAQPAESRPAPLVAVETKAAVGAPIASAYAAAEPIAPAAAEPTAQSLASTAELAAASASTAERVARTTGLPGPAAMDADGRDGAASQPGHPSRSWASPAIRRALREADLTPAEVTPSGPAGRITMQDVANVDAKGGAPRGPDFSAESSSVGRQNAVVPAAGPRAGASLGASSSASAPSSSTTSTTTGASSIVSTSGETRREDVVPMTMLRRRIAERLVSAQQSAALLTTFNEVDMSNLLALRTRVQDKFTQKHGIKLGFMSFFVKAVVEALKGVPALNAEIRGDQIIYRHYFDVGVAVGGGRGLVVPILRNAESLGFADIERQIADYARRAKENKLKVEDLQGGTFTISNGGVYGSLLSTPIVNPPQSGILGMHAIQDRPVVRDGQIVAAKMMYIALTYDHRIVDGREAVTFLVRVKDFIEDPTRLLFDL